MGGRKSRVENLVKKLINLKEKFKGKKIVVSGHTGFKGAWLSKILLNWGADVIGIGLKPNTAPNLFEALGLKNKMKSHFRDIRDLQHVKRILVEEKPEILFHLAAQPLVIESYENPIYTFETNIIGTANILEAMREAGTIKSAVLVTTDKVYSNNGSGRPFKEEDKLGGHDPYSSSKAAAEIVIESYIKSFFNLADYGKKHRTLIASARAGNVLGGGDWNKYRLVPDLVKGIFKGETVSLRNPSAVRPWQHVLEALYGYLLLAVALYSGKKEFCGSWNFGPGSKNFLSVKEFADIALKILGQGKYLIVSDSNKKHEDRLLTLNSRKAKKHLGWQQKLGINETLALTFDWYRSFYNNEEMNGVTDRQIELFLSKI